MASDIGRCAVAHNVMPEWLFVALSQRTTAPPLSAGHSLLLSVCEQLQETHAHELIHKLQQKPTFLNSEIMKLFFMQLPVADFPGRSQISTTGILCVFVLGKKCSEDKKCFEA